MARPARPQGVPSANRGAIRLWETATGRMIRRLAGPKEPIRSLAFSPDGKLLASGGEDRSVCLWETAGGKIRRLLEGPRELRKLWEGWVRSLTFSPDGKTLAVGGSDYSLYVWDVASGRTLREMPGVGSTTCSG